MKTDAYMKAAGSVIDATARATKGSAMATNTWGTTATAKCTAKVCTLGTMAKVTMANGPWALNMAMGSGKETTETSISGSGIRTKRMATVCMSGKTVTDTKASGSSA